MTATFALIERLKQIPDYRLSKGRRHALWLVLLLILLGTLCGYRGYRPLADFSKAHWPDLCEMLSIPQTTRIPSYSTFRRVLQQVPFAPLVDLFNDWSRAVQQIQHSTWVASDGKSIRSTLTNYSESYQNFISTVSAFTHDRGLVLHLQMMSNQELSEIEVVREVIRSLQGQPVVFTLDALHCQKKPYSRLWHKGNTT